MIQIAKYGIIVLAFVGEFQHQRTLVSPTPTETGMKARKPNPISKKPTQIALPLEHVGVATVRERLIEQLQK